VLLGYARVSTNEQTEGASIEEQVRVLKGLAMARGISQYDLQLFIDEGVSGAKPLRWRPEGFKLWETAKSGDLVVAAKLDRMFRDVHDAFNVYKAWMEKGVDLILYDMSMDPITREGTGQLMFTILSAFAHFERGRIRERILEGKRNKAEKGGHTGGEAPLGYRIEGKGREARLVPVEAEQEILAECRRMGDDILPKHAARRLNDLGFRTRTGRLFSETQARRALEHAYGRKCIPYTKKLREWPPRREFDPYSEAGAYKC
jgi:DNA invertase Pin-like site-specific DNA recombinase